MRFAFLLLAFTASCVAQTGRYSNVKIQVDSKTDLYDLAEAGVVIDHPIVTEIESGFLVDVVLNEWEVEQLSSSGFSFEVVVPDLTAAFANRPPVTEAQRADLERGDGLEYFSFGTMAGFLRQDELLTELEEMRELFPSLATERVSIGQTHEGRDIWMVKISANADADENEPEALYTAIHHAREPQSMMTVVYFMWHLLENYGTDTQITDLLNSRELYFIPMINVDGYVYNETTDPDGGGFWRKNRLDNDDGSFGVDLNRNYGYLWGLDNSGSSPNTSSETYRGTGAFSEPETQAIRDFVEDHQFVAALNFHSRGEEYLYPWGYQEMTYTPDNDLFYDTSADMAFENGYEFGTGPDVLYPVNGSSDDWMYGEQVSKPKILAWTPEVCNRTTDGFWPPVERIIPIAQENLRANLVIAELAGTFPVSSEPQGTVTQASLSAAFPNPFISITSARLQLDKPSGIELDVIDVLGRSIYKEDQLYASAGQIMVSWDGSTNSGTPATAGVYFLQIRIGDQNYTQQVVKTD